ncbi:MAG: N-acetylmuramoyl-L-alanine amidase [Clostridiaceae bacterium]|nr:N-acetylmuramoyl-L-alanine amidase [Clostridiaceae bacterium]
MKTIVIDAGHGGYDYGAVSGGRYEKDDNLRLARLVAENLRAAGERVIMTRNSDTFVPLLERSAISNNAGADLFVSLHRNASENAAASGIETYVYPAAGQTTRMYAEIVNDSMAAVGALPDRGIKEGNFSVLRNTRAPAMLIELGFLTNQHDNAVFDENIEQYAAAISNGILRALNEEPGPGPSPNPAVIKEIQTTLNSRYGAGLAVDGVFGARTKSAVVRGLQTELNRIYGARLVVDGVFGPKTKAAIRPVSRGARGNIVYLLQAALYAAGYHIAVDGIFGAETEAAVRDYQAKHGLVVDGVAGANTFESLLK